MYVWGWRRLRYVQWYVKRKQRADAFERALREAREAIDSGCAYRVPGDGDRELLELLTAAAPVCDELAACDFRVLCELIVQHAGKPAIGAARALVDRAGTTVALVVVWRRTTRFVVRLVSWAGERAFLTARKPDASLAQPPSVERTVIDAKTIAELVERHRAITGDAPARAIASGDELLAQLVAQFETIARWRAAQPPDELLDADLACVLGDAYARSGKAWARRLRGKLPEATLHRRA